MGEVFAIHQKRYFSKAQARALLPVIRRITREAADRVCHLSARLNHGQTFNKVEIEREVQETFLNWQSKVARLGGQPKGMWLVDFDHGQGCYCWVFPETDIEFEHGYDEGYRGRVRVE